MKTAASQHCAATIRPKYCNMLVRHWVRHKPFPYTSFCNTPQLAYASSAKRCHGICASVLPAAWFWQDPAATVLVTGLFAGAAVTDWLDGYLARKLVRNVWSLQFEHPAKIQLAHTTVAAVKAHSCSSTVALAQSPVTIGSQSCSATVLLK